MNDLQIFNNEEFGEVRMTEIDGKPYFVATDVATALGYATPRDAVSRHCKGVVKRDTPTSSGVQSMSYINEGDLYRLIMKSKLPSAEKFELTAGVTSYLNSVMLGKIEPTVVQNEPVVVEQTYVEPTVPTCRKKYSCSRFRKLGRVRYGDYTYTWYSQRALPGGGLNIPGRHLNEHGLVVDENEYVVIASDDLPHGTVVDTPIGVQGIVYDEGSGNGNLDIYCDW